MAKTAAAMTGLALAACSIGFNTIRYPIVSEMVGPAMASAPSREASVPAASEPAKKEIAPAPPARPEIPSPPDISPVAADAKREASSKPAARVEIKPVPDMAREIALPAKDSATKADEAAPTSAVVPEKPLVPVSSAGDLGVAVRRLPPIDSATPPNWQSGLLPLYPSTGIR